jgi:hypothetical protein
MQPFFKRGITRLKGAQPITDHFTFAGIFA